MLRTMHAVTSARFEPPPGAVRLRRDLRAFLAEHQPKDAPERRLNCWYVPDPAFSRALAAAGYVGMTWPKPYGGHERHPFERYIVMEELLAAGAPCGAHWIADRQTGPLILRYGTPTQRERYVPAMARGELYSCIGLSEPGAGSDLASVSTSAARTADGWRINGQKVWTSNAHHATVMLTLVRTTPGSQRTEGLSQFLIDLDTPGVTVRPIVDLTGGHDFNEVFLDDVLVGADALVGVEGEGWKQVTAELALERSGPERYMSSHALLVALIDTMGAQPNPAVRDLVGRLTAELWTLRLMSMSTMARLIANQEPMVAAAIVKDLGNTFEQTLPQAVQGVLDETFDLADDTALARMLALLLQIAPSFSLRGGTREILRGIIARGLGLR
jgi:alkylation response protein AidB-like acyl-CoA dehydrogenase